MLFTYDINRFSHDVTHISFQGKLTLRIQIWNANTFSQHYKIDEAIWIYSGAPNVSLDTVLLVGNNSKARYVCCILLGGSLRAQTLDNDPVGDAQKKRLMDIRNNVRSNPLKANPEKRFILPVIIT